MSNLRVSTLESLGSGDVFELDKLGYTFEYAAGVTVSSNSQIIKDGGLLYRASGSTPLPYTTTGSGMPESGAFIEVDGALLRQDLANPDKGAAMVARSVIVVHTVSEMIDLLGIRVGSTVRTLGYYAPGDGGGCDYEIVAAGTGVDDGGSFIDLSGSGLQAKGLFWKGEVNVNQFGAIGDGVADDTLAIQSAVDFARNIIFVNPQYLKSSPITISNDNTVLSGQGGIVEANPGTGFMVTAGVSGVGFYGLSLTGQSDENVSTFGLGISFRSGCNNVKVVGCNISGYSSSIFGEVGCSNMEFSGNTFSNAVYIPAMESQGYGILLEACKNTKTFNNTFLETVERHHLYYGTTSLSPTVFGGDHQIFGNYFTGTTGLDYSTGFEYLVKIMGNRNVTISANNFSSGMGHVWMTSDGSGNNCRNITISGNTFTGAEKRNSSDSACISSSASTVIGFAFVGNSFTNNAVDAHIYMNHGVSGNISSNSISQVLAGNGIQFSGAASDVLIANNILRIRTEGRNIWINSVANPAFVSTDLFIKNNITIGGTFGIFLAYAPTTIITGNEVKGASYTAIHCIGDFTGTISHNTIYVSEIGINIEGATGGFAWVFGNTITVSARAVKVHEGLLTVEPIKNFNANAPTARKKTVTTNSPPTTGTWAVGDMAEYVFPTAGGFVGSVCTVAGTPGTWKGFGAVEA